MCTYVLLTLLYPIYMLYILGRAISNVSRAASLHACMHQEFWCHDNHEQIQFVGVPCALEYSGNPRLGEDTVVRPCSQV